MNNSIKVLHLLQSDRFSGAENMVCQIIKMFKDEKNIEMVYCSQDGTIQEMLMEHDIPFYPMKKLCAKEVKRVIKEYQPTIIHAHDIRASVIASKYADKIKVVSHIHGNHENMRKINIKSIIYWAVSRKFKNILWVSNSALKNYKYNSLIKNKSIVLYNIINTHDIYNRVLEDKVNYNYDIIFLGRLTYPKNPIRVIDVLKLVASEIPDIKIAVVGCGELYENTEKHAVKLGIRSNMDFYGFKDNPLKILYNSKVMIMTSVFEGTPMCVLEAMALGVPVVSTPTDGIADIVKDGKTGYLSNDDKKLAEYIVFLLKNQDIRKKMSNLSILESKEINDVNNYRTKLLNIYFE